MKNELRENHFWEMIEIITNNQTTFFDKKLSINKIYFNYNETIFYKTIEKNIIKFISNFQKIVLEREINNENYPFYIEGIESIERQILKIIFENIFIELDKDIREVNIYIGENKIQASINIIPWIIEVFFEENKKIEIYKKWLNEKIQLIESKILTNVSVVCAKSILKENSSLINFKIYQTINEIVFNKKMPKSLKLLNKIIIKKIENEQITNFIQFKSFITKINTFFKSLDDDFFKLDYLYLKKVGKEQYTKKIPKTNQKLNEFDEKILNLLFIEFKEKVKFWFYLNKWKSNEEIEVFKYIFFINVGWLHNNEENLFNKFCNDLINKYSKINDENTYKKELIGNQSNYINGIYFDGKINTFDKYQESWVKNEFETKDYEEEIKKILKNKIQPNLIEIFNNKGINFQIENLDFDFINRQMLGKSIWDVVLLIFNDNYELLIKDEEWLENFIYRFVYQNEMLNFWDEKRKEKTIILDSYNKEKLVEKTKKFLSKFLDKSNEINIDPFIFVENNLLSPSKRVAFARYEYFGDILYKLIIDSLKLKCVIKADDKINYFSSNFQNKLASEIGLDKMIETNGLFFDSKKKSFELADYLEALLWNLYLDKGFEYAYNSTKKMFENSFSEYLIDENIMKNLEDYKNSNKMIKNLELIYEEDNLCFLFEEQRFIFEDNIVSNDVIQKLTRNIVKNFILINQYDNKENFKNYIFNYVTLEKSKMHLDLTIHNLNVANFWRNRNLSLVQLRHLFFNDFPKFEETIKNIIEIKKKEMSL